LQSATPASLAIATQPESDLKQASDRFLQQIQSMRVTQADHSAKQVSHDLAEALQEQENLARDTVRARQQLQDIQADVSRTRQQLEVAQAELQQVHECVFTFRSHSDPLVCHVNQNCLSKK
jgi:predicted  nucleic acid-binding Zn-ribbon protein